MEEFEEKVTKLNESSEFQSWMTPEEDFEWCKKMERHYGKKEGYVQGAQENKMETAKKMLENNEEMSKIIQYTNLTEKDILNIQLK